MAVSDWSYVEFGKSAKSRRAPILLPLLSDILMVWDATTCGASSVAARIATENVIGAPWSQTGLRHFDIITMVACFLAALILRDCKFAGAKHRIFGTYVTIKATPRLLALLMVICVSTQLLVEKHNAEEFFFIGWASLYVACLGISRIACHCWLCHLDRFGALRKSIAIICADSSLASLTALIGDNADIVGTYQLQRRQMLAINDLERVFKLGQDGALDSILVAPEADNQCTIDSLIETLKILPVEVALYESGRSKSSYLLDAQVFGGMEVTIVADRIMSRRDFIIKDIIDKIGAVILLVLTLPILLFVGISIKLTSKGPVFFAQERQGWCGKEFTLFKFRTMREPPDGSRWFSQTVRNDRRCTWVGRVLRRTSLDELPQLINVLRGEMSLVGPRPHAPHLHDLQRMGQEIIADYAKRHRVKPGLTGWAQINGARGPTTTDDLMRLRLNYDLYYIEHWSFWLDLRILAYTPICIIGENVY